MAIGNTFSLESNKKIKINFNGGDLSSDGGLLLIKEFAAKIGLTRLLKRAFHTQDTSEHRIHSDSDNLMQAVYQIIAAYFEDDCADELTCDPVMTAVLDKLALASQPTLSRFFSRMNESTLERFDQIDQGMRQILYSIRKPEHILFDWDSTLLNTYGNQEGEGFIVNDINIFTRQRNTMNGQDKQNAKQDHIPVLFEISPSHGLNKHCICSMSTIKR